MSEKIVKVVVCSGTTCYVMGASELLLLDEQIPANWAGDIQIEGTPCLGLCKDKKYGKAPYVKVDEEIISAATIPTVLQKIAEKLGER